MSMNLIATKDFRMVGRGKPVRKGERFVASRPAGKAYKKNMVAEDAPSAPKQTYLTRAMTTETAEPLVVKRPRGRPRKVKPAE